MKYLAVFVGAWALVAAVLWVFLYGLLSSWHWGAWSFEDMGSAAPNVSYVTETALQWGVVVAALIVVVLLGRALRRRPGPHG